MKIKILKKIQKIFCLSQIFLSLLFSSQYLVEFRAQGDEVTLPLDVPVHGRIFSDFYLPIHRSTLNQVSGSVWLQADPKLSENAYGHFTLTASQLEASVVPGKTGFYPGVREAKVSFFKEGWEFRAGKMIIPWGNSDGINPTDFLSGKDYTFFNPDEEVKRIGATGLWLSWTPRAGQSPMNLTLVVLPVLAQSKVLLAPGQVPASFVIADTFQTPATTLSNISLALKTTYTGNQWDASLLAYRGFNSLPEFQATSVGEIPLVPILNASFGFHRFRALGGDISLTVGKWVLKTEDAYVWTENNDGQNPLTLPSYLSSVISVERPLGADFRVQTQIWVRYYPNYLSPAQASGPNPLQALINQQVARANALIQNYQDRVRPAGTLRVTYTDERDGLEAQLLIAMNFNGGDYLLRPKLDYSISDSLKATLGMDYYAGPADRPFGVLEPFSSVFTEFRYLF